MAIRRSAAGTIAQLIEELGSSDADGREAAAARLSVIGERAVAHLLDAFAVSPSAVARAAMLQVLESIRDRRGLVLALDQLAAHHRDPVVASAAIRLLAAFVDDEHTEALEALGAIVLDTTRPEAERLAAWSAIAAMPPRIIAPIRKSLQVDPNPTLRAIADRNAPPPEPTPSPRSLVDTALAGEPVDPEALAASLRRAPDEVPIPALHQLVEEIGNRERAIAVEADRREWIKARAAVHQVLAGRGSRVALYDVRDTLASATSALPEGFLLSVSQVGDAASLESIADALARVPTRIDRHEQSWRDRLVEAGRAIVSREHLTRRHAVARRLARRHPDIARVLFAPRADARRQ